MIAKLSASGDGAASWAYLSVGGQILFHYDLRALCRNAFHLAE